MDMHETSPIPQVWMQRKVIPVPAECLLLKVFTHLLLPLPATDLTFSKMREMPQSLKDALGVFLTSFTIQPPSVCTLSYSMHAYQKCSY